MVEHRGKCDSRALEQNKLPDKSFCAAEEGATKHSFLHFCLDGQKKIAHNSLQLTGQAGAVSKGAWAGRANIRFFAGLLSTLSYAFLCLLHSLDPGTSIAQPRMIYEAARCFFGLNFFVTCQHNRPFTI